VNDAASPVWAVPDTCNLRTPHQDWISLNVVAGSPTTSIWHLSKRSATL
jgi:hypothetical protein